MILAKASTSRQHVIYLSLLWSLSTSGKYAPTNKSNQSLMILSWSCFAQRIKVRVSLLYLKSMRMPHVSLMASTTLQKGLSASTRTSGLCAARLMVKPQSFSSLNAQLRKEKYSCLITMKLGRASIQPPTSSDSSQCRTKFSLFCADK